MQLKPEKQLKIISSTEDIDINPKIIDVFTTSVFNAIKRGAALKVKLSYLLLHVHANVAITSLDSLMLQELTVQSKHLRSVFKVYKKRPQAGKILGAILEEQYSSGSLDSVQSLLDWGFWPQYFELYGKCY